MMITATPKKGEKFQKGVSWLKQTGFKFDAGSRTWRLPASWRSDGRTWEEALAHWAAGPQCTPAQYLARQGVELLSGAAPKNPAQDWMGQASMDHPDSHF